MVARKKVAKKPAGNDEARRRFVGPLPAKGRRKVRKPSAPSITLRAGMSLLQRTIQDANNRLHLELEELRRSVDSVEFRFNRANSNLDFIRRRLDGMELLDDPPDVRLEKMRERQLEAQCRPPANGLNATTDKE